MVNFHVSIWNMEKRGTIKLLLFFQEATMKSLSIEEKVFNSNSSNLLLDLVPIILYTFPHIGEKTRGQSKSSKFPFSPIFPTKLLLRFAHVAITKHVNLPATSLFTVIGKLDGACRLVYNEVPYHWRGMGANRSMHRAFAHAFFGHADLFSLRGN